MSDWIQWFGSMEGHDFFCQVDRSFIGTYIFFSLTFFESLQRQVVLTPFSKHTIESRFNLYGLNEEVRNFSECLNIILDYVNSDSSSEEWNREEWSRKECMDLYGRIHARFLLTTRGQQLMFQKYRNEDFGHCPRVQCDGYPVLPVGLSDIPGEQRVMTYCPKCQDVFVPPMKLAARYVDGAYFGVSFPHFMLMSYPEYVPVKHSTPYVPLMFGYRISKTAPAANFPCIEDFRGLDRGRKSSDKTESSSVVQDLEEDNTSKSANSREKE
eukprot:g1342.t1